MQTKTLVLTDTQIKDLKKRHAHGVFRYDIPYSLFQVKGSDYSITVYTSKKVVFQGENLNLILAPYMQSDSETLQTSTASAPKAIRGNVSATFPMAGSDEVGTGDYFGPVTVCACFVEEAHLLKIPKERIMDSKAMTDSVVMEIAPQLISVLPHSLLILDNKKYNAIHATHNMNVIKAKLHNQAYLHLAKKVHLPALSVVDQFMPKDAYYKALNGIEDVYKPLHFETKAENKYFAVACASVIARYAFLTALESMGEHYGVTFPKGAGSHVDTFGAKFVKEYGTATLNSVAKVHFKNTERITADVSTQ